MENEKSSWNWLGYGAIASASLSGVWLARKRITSLLFSLPPATHEITVERNVQIRAADGEMLVHDHFRPKSTTPLPTILVRTAYGRALSSFTGLFKEVLLRQYAERGYHVILQDTRGRYSSSGDFEPYINEPDDGKTTIDWIVRQPWSDGQIGMTGQSYVGFTQYAAVSKDVNHHIKALFPIVTRSRLGHLPEHAYPLDLAIRWLFLLDTQKRTDLPVYEKLRRLTDVKYQNKMLETGFRTLPLANVPQAIFGRNNAIFDNWLAHSDENNPYWDKLDQRSVIAHAPPTHFVGGWYDLFITEQIEDYQRQRAVGQNPYLTVGPWIHLDASNQSGTLAESLNWFDKHLKGIDRVRQKPVRVLLMGANEWREFDQWPPPAIHATYYLHGDGTLIDTCPSANAQPSRYQYDPNDPTPNLGGPLISLEAGPTDNRPLEARDDVLTFTTQALSVNYDVIGHPSVTLFVKTSAVSADFFGRLCDVHPDGQSINICDEIYRIKPERDSTLPNGMYKVTFTLSPTAHRFKAGHRIRLQISSGAFPRFQRNLGANDHFMFAERMVIAQQTVFHDKQCASSLTLPVMQLMSG